MRKVKIPGKVIGFVGIDNFKSVSSSLRPDQIQQINTFIDAMRKNYKQVTVAIVKMYFSTQLYRYSFCKSRFKRRCKYRFRGFDWANQSEIDLHKETGPLSQLKLPLHFDCK
jgi:c-di-AMP phosphodiesterase-like protein